MIIRASFIGWFDSFSVGRSNGLVPNLTSGDIHPARAGSCSGLIPADSSGSWPLISHHDITAPVRWPLRHTGTIR